MKNVRLIASAVALYGVANGLLLNATPQASLQLKLSSEKLSETLGFIAAGVPVGYTLSCLLAGRFLSAIRAKYVLLCGVGTAVTGLLIMSNAHTPNICATAQLICGVAGGMFWPFASAWMLDFQTPEIPRTKILRYYNVAWTSGTAFGMFVSGMLCQRGYVFQSIQLAAGVTALSFIVALIPKSTTHTSAIKAGDSATHTSHVGLALLIAAVTANLTALWTRSMLWNNYAELNKLHGFGADRMGVITALSLASQVTGFLFGSIYEKWLGLRRIYIAMAVAIVCANLAYAYSTSLPILMAATIALGITLALGFQSAIFAAIHFFKLPRTATTFHEACVGSGGLMPLVAGHYVAALKTGGHESLEALQAPFLTMAGVVCVFLTLQMVLVGRRLSQRALFAPPSIPVVHNES